ncbi:MAG: SET domain-containing protein-lysine N-methyltransferase, partial [Rhodothermales bacterium]|nr:SET domain-containing protein-lysine N-methyltransferase [Rhodothermales bacterium]
MLHPDTELRFISDDVGYGVVATQPIPKGTITWVHDDLDRTFSLAEVDAMPPIFRTILD